MKENYFFSQPHQPFFVLAFINAIITMLLFMLSYKGILTLTISPSLFHAYSLVFLLFTPAFLGFILTTFPRFSSTAPIEKSHYMAIVGLFFLGTLLFIVGAFLSTIIYKIAIVTIFIGEAWAVKILLDIYKSSQMTDKHDTFWILVAMVFGLLSHFIFNVSELFGFTLQTLAIEIAIYLYLFLLAFSVAQRMIPFFSHCMIERNKYLLKIIVSLLALHIVLDIIYPNLSFIADGALAFVIAKELFRWNLPFPNPNPLLWILHISLFWIPIAFLFASISNLTTLIDGTTFLFLDIHILMLGFLFTVLIGFGTRVTLGHSGNMMQADKWVRNLFIWTQVVVVMRLFTSIVAAWGYNYMVLFDISVTVWLVMFILWGIRFFAVLIKGKKLTESKTSFSVKK